MIEVKTYPVNIALYKQEQDDDQKVVFVSSFPHSHDIYTWPQGKVNKDTLQFIQELAVVLGIHIAVSDNQSEVKE